MPDPKLDELCINTIRSKIITPVAEEEGIRLGIHPCDPPVPVLSGIPQLLRSFDAYKRLVDTYPSD